MDNRQAPASFEVTCVIGTVHLAILREFVGPVEAAFQLIAQHDTPGTFSFSVPGNDRQYKVTVEYEGEGE